MGQRHGQKTTLKSLILGPNPLRWCDPCSLPIADRHQCGTCNGQTRKVGESFTVDGEHLKHPGDPAGSPGNVINCHCVAIAVPPEQA